MHAKTVKKCRLTKLTEGLERTSLIFEYCEKALDKIAQVQIHKDTLQSRNKRKAMKSNLYNAFRKASSLLYARIVTSPINESLK